MGIKRFIDQNNKLIMYVIFMIVFILLVIKSLNSYYEKEEQEKLANIKQNNSIQNSVNNSSSNNTSTDTTQNDEVDINTIDGVIKIFVDYCNNKEIQEAYNMLTDECKNSMYKTKEEFQKNYINTVFKEKKEYSMLKWDSEDNIETYQIKFIGDILATGGNENISQEFYTFVNSDDTYKININNYIYGKSINKEYNNNGVSIKVKNVDVYNSYEQYEISFTNNTSKEICLTGNKYIKNIYLKNSRGTTYSSLNSDFDNGDITLKPGNTKNYVIKFNRIYSSQNKVTTLVLSDVIFNYEEYLNTENKNNYINRTSIEIEF